MESTREIPEPEVLLAEAGWMRRLALRLVGDPAGAEDVVQDAWLAALEKRPRVDGSGSLRSWLGRVVRNLALRRRRREGMRGDVERHAARNEAVAGEQQAIDQLASVQLVSAALLTIAEPYRSAVTLRHLQGLAAREIAARQGCSVESARQRVSRGLGLLRAELDRRSGGDRSSWCLALAASWGIAREVTPASLALTTVGSVGGVFMGVKSLAAGVGACLALGALMWWQMDEPPAQLEAAAGPELRALEVEPDVRGEGAPGDLRSEGVARAERAAVGTREPESRPPGARFAGRVVDAAGAPLEGVALELRGVEEQGDPEHAGNVLAREPSGEAGRFELDPGGQSGDQARAGELWVRAQAQGRLVGWVRVDREGDSRLEITLLRSPVLFGQLLAPDGSLVTGPGKVSIRMMDEAGEEHAAEATVQADGSFRTSDLVPGRLQSLRALARGFAPTEIERQDELRAEREQELDLVLDPGLRIEGLVLEAESREPVPFAEVWSGGYEFDAHGLDPSAVADDRGVFVLEGVERRHMDDDRDGAFALVSVAARAQGFVSRGFNIELARRVREGVFEVELRLESARASVDAFVTWPEGEPARHQMVYAIDSQKNFRYEQTDGQGRFQFEGLPAGRLEVMVWPGGPVEEDAVGYARASVELVDGQRARMDIELQRGGDVTIAGQVRDEAGSPVPGQKVRLARKFNVRGLSIQVSSDTALSDADGRYVFERVAPGDLRVSVELAPESGLAARESKLSLELKEGDSQADVDFVLARAIALSGWVEAGSYPQDELRLQLRSARDDDHLRDLELGSDGSFEHGGLYPGPYVLVLLHGSDELDREPTPAAGGDGLRVVVGP